MGDKGIVASTAGLAILLNEGIGDTIRVSLTPEPGAPREREVEIAQQVLQSLGLRSFLPQVSACPGCGRTTSTFFQEMAQQIQGYLKERMPEWRETHPGAEDLRVAVMGCVVNGPGESKHADIGISLPGTFEEPVAPGVHRRPARSHAARRRAGRRVHRDPRGLRRGALPDASLIVEASTLPGVYSRQLNGRSATWVTPTFLFERRTRHRTTNGGHRESRLRRCPPPAQCREADLARAAHRGCRGRDPVGLSPGGR